MKNQIISLSIGACALCVQAATTYYWKTPADGSWNTAENWCTDSGRTTPSEVVPGISEADIVSFPVGAYTVSASGNDLKVDAIDVKTATTAGNGVVLDIGGQTLRTTRTSAFICLNGSGPVTKRDFAKPYTSFEFRNGVYDLTTSYLQMIVTPAQQVIDDRRGCFVVGQGADVRTTFFEKFYNGSRVFVQDGGKLTCSTGSTLGHSLANYPVASYYPFICVTGQTSQATINGQVALGTPGAGLYALDGATVKTGTLKIGYDVNSTNCFVRVDNATLSVNGIIELGGEKDSNVGSAIEIVGERARLDVRGGNGQGLKAYNGTGAHVDFEIPADGFKDADGNVTVPLTACKYTPTPRGDGQENLGETELRIKAKKWARRHPLESITLILLDNTHYSGTSALAANAKVLDLKSDDGTPLVTAVDGNKIVLTAPRCPGLMLILK